MAMACGAHGYFFLGFLSLLFLLLVILVGYPGVVSMAMVLWGPLALSMGT